MNVFSGIQRLNSVQEEVMKKCESVVEDLFAEAVDGEHKGEGVQNCGTH